MGEVVGGMVRDVRVAGRSLLRSPGFTLACVLTLALGVGPNTALFSVLHSLVLAPLPYPEAERLVVIRRDLVTRGISNYPAAPADLVDYRENSDAFSAIAGYVSAAPIVTDGSDTERLRGISATPELFEVLGVRPALGRAFSPEEGIAVAPGEGQPQRPFPVIISHGYWMRAFGGDPDAVGTVLPFANANGTIVGVMPEGFRLLLSPDDGVPAEPDVILPFTIDPLDPFRGSFFLGTLGRLAPGVSLDVAEEEMKAVGAVQQAKYPSARAAGTTIRLARLEDDVSAEVRPLLLSLAGAVAFVLLIACVNVANLLLVRSAGRAREIAVRTALGGGRARIVRQILSEAVVLATLGGVAGVALAWMALPFLERALPPELPRLGVLSLNLPVLAFSVATISLAALLFGALPAVRGARTHVMGALRGRTGSGGASVSLRSGLVVVEVALSFLLVLGAGLTIRSFLALTHVDPGFQVEGVLTFRATLPAASYPGADALGAVNERLRQELLATPGIERVGAASELPFDGGARAAPYGGEAELADGDESDLRQAYVRTAGNGYFEALETPLVAGRFLTSDDAGTDRVLVDEVLAQRTWPGEMAVGKRIFVKVQVPGEWFEVVGVVGHQRQTTLSGPSQETIYFAPLGGIGGVPGRWVLRTAGDPRALVAGVRAAVARVDDRILVENLEPLSALVSEARAPTRVVAAFVATFGALALALALVGLYGVIAYLVRERRGEFGLRLALGANRSSILRVVLARGLLLSGTGIGLGLLGSLSLGPLLGTVLVEVPSPDGSTIGGVIVLFVLMAGCASLIPARRALQVDPMVTLRQE